MLSEKRALRCAVVTSTTSKLSGALKADASSNIEPMSVTLDVAKCRGWLNATAPRNMAPMSWTLDVEKCGGW